MVGKVVWTTLKLLWIYRPDYKCWKGSGPGGGGGGGGDFLSEKGMKFSVFMPVRKPHLLLEERAQVYVYRIKSEMDSLKLVVITIIRSWKEIQIRAGLNSVWWEFSSYYCLTKWNCWIHVQRDKLFQCFCVFWPKSRLPQPDSSF